jgi:DnaJ-class molecular chaperone
MADAAWELLREYCMCGAPDGFGEVWDFPLGPESVGVAYKQACKRAHPDTGGSQEEFVAVDRARHVLLAWLERQADAPVPAHGGAAECPRCHGAGRIMMHRGVRQMPMQCPACQGNGEIYDDRESTGDRL